MRFGADKVFRSKDSEISDADIDAILAEGRKKTDELNSRLAQAEKGDMLDFSFDGGMKTQEFEGVDYTLAENRAAASTDDVDDSTIIDPQWAHEMDAPAKRAARLDNVYDKTQNESE